MITIIRDHLVKSISDQEAQNKSLKDKQKSAVSVQVDAKKQTKLWKDLLRQMELKRRLVNVWNLRWKKKKKRERNALSIEIGLLNVEFS